MLSKVLLSILIVSILFTSPFKTFANEEDMDEAAVAAEQKEEALLAQKREELYRRMETLTHIPWYYIAAMDRYEKNIQRKSKEKNEFQNDRVTAITISPQVWSGGFNPIEDDTNPSAIGIFHGIGRDGNGDGLAERNNDEDVLYSIAEFIAQYGTTEKDVRIALWNYYLRNQTVKVISEFATIIIAHTLQGIPSQFLEVIITPTIIPGETREDGVAAASMREPIFLQVMEPLSVLPVGESLKLKAGTLMAVGEWGYVI